LLAFTVVTFCQQITQKHSITKTDYLQKSKKQKKTAWIFLGSGAALIVAAVVIPQGESTGFQIDPIGGGYEGHKNDGIKGVLGLTGVVSMLGSIPFFIASGKNKKRANRASVFINMERTPVLQGTSIINQSLPVIGLQIKIHKVAIVAYGCEFFEGVFHQQFLKSINGKTLRFKFFSRDRNQSNVIHISYRIFKFPLTGHPQHHATKEPIYIKTMHVRGIVKFTLQGLVAIALAETRC